VTRRDWWLMRGLRERYWVGSRNMQD